MTTYYLAQLGIALSTLNLEKMKQEALEKAAAKADKKPNKKPQKKIEFRNKITKKLQLNRRSN